MGPQGPSAADYWLVANAAWSIQSSHGGVAEIGTSFSYHFPVDVTRCAITAQTESGDSLAFQRNGATDITVLGIPTSGFDVLVYCD